MISLETLPSYVREAVCGGCENLLFDDMTLAHVSEHLLEDQIEQMAVDLAKVRSEITIDRVHQRFTCLFYTEANKNNAVVLDRTDLCGVTHLRIEKAYRIVEIDGHRLLFYLDAYDTFNAVDPKYKIRCAVNPSGTLHHGVCEFSPYTTDGVGQMTCHMSADLCKIVEREMWQMWKTW